MDRRLLVAALLGAGLAGCASQPRVWTGLAPGANPASYGSFAWAEVAAPAGTNSVVFEHIRQRVEGAMLSRGYAKAEAADLSVVLTLGAKDKVQVHSWNHGRYGRGWGWGGWDPWGGDIDVYQYTEGRIMVDVFDTRTRQAVWHGEARQTINPVRPDFEKLDAAVALVMAGFPSKG